MKRKQLWFGGLAVTVVLLGVGSYFLFRHKDRGVTYRPTTVHKGEIQQTILSTGTVAPMNRLDLKAPVAGRIEEVLVREGQHVKKGQVLAWMSSTERAALIDTASSRGAEEMAYWEASYKKTPLLAPGPGLVILKNVDSGQTVTQTDTLLSLSDRLIVKASVDETDLAMVKVGQPVSIVLDAFSSEPLEAKVFHIGYDAKTVNNVTTYEVDVAPAQTPAFMKSGMTVNVSFLIAERADALWIPAASIRKERGKTFVLMPGDGGEPKTQEIQTGISDGKKVEVTGGLAEGDTVLIAAVRSMAKEGGNPTSPFGGPPRGPRGGGGGGPR